MSKSETHHEPDPSLLGVGSLLDALLPGDGGHYVTTITDDYGNVVAQGCGDTSQEAERNASEEAKDR